MIEKERKMADINDYREEKSCVYKGEEYLVRDNGAVLRKPRPNQRARKLDDEWTFGKLNTKTGYLEIASVRVHRIVALAFHGEQPTNKPIVYHIDKNKRNNRPSNLRWITRLENVVLNDNFRKSFKNQTGLRILDVLKNPSSYKDAFDCPSFNWIKSITDEEAKACLESIEWWSTIFDSLTPLAKQRNWTTPTAFVCCPTETDGDPIQCYLKNLSEGAVFAENQYGKSTVVKYDILDNNAIVIFTTIPSTVKFWGVAKVTFERGYFIHTSLGSFFAEDGTEKKFTLEQGLVWTGGDTFDDYC